MHLKVAWSVLYSWPFFVHFLECADEQNRRDGFLFPHDFMNQPFSACSLNAQ